MVIGVSYEFVDGDGNEHTFAHTFNKSETVGNEGQNSNGDTGMYTAVISRNITRIIFEVYT